MSPTTLSGLQQLSISIIFMADKKIRRYYGFDQLLRPAKKPSISVEKVKLKI